jgi:DNA-binding transcriptional ArsR family regulator
MIRAFQADPVANMAVFVAQMQAYWETAVEPFWSRIQALCMADLSYRAKQFAVGGVAQVLEGLHPLIRLHAGRMYIDKPQYCRHRSDEASNGIVLIPSAFAWPNLIVSCGCTVDHPSLIYSPRGVAELWNAEPEEVRDQGLGAVMGRTRVSILGLLASPRNTTDLAHELAMSAAAVSQHLKALKEASLVTSQRHGRVVLYHRTPAATALINASGVSNVAG